MLNKVLYRTLEQRLGPVMFYKDCFRKTTVLPCLIPSSSSHPRKLGVLPGAVQEEILRVQPRLVISDAYPWPIEIFLGKALRKAQGPRSLDNVAVVVHVDEPGKKLLPVIDQRTVFWRVAVDAAELQGRGPSYNVVEDVEASLPLECLQFDRVGDPCSVLDQEQERPNGKMMAVSVKNLTRPILKKDTYMRKKSNLG